jgi:ArsR family transcriptional regulator
VYGGRKGEKCICLNGNEIVAPEEVVEDLDSFGGFWALKDRIPNEEEVERKAYFHKAMSDPIRIRILVALSFCDMCPCVLKEVLEMTDSKLSYHLNILENADLIECRKDKNWRIYSLTERGRNSLEII